MQAFEIGKLRLIAGFDQGLKASLDESGGASAEDSLLAKEIGFGLFLEGGFKHSRAGAADSFCIRKRKSWRVAAGILLDSDETGRSAAFSKDFANAMAGSFGRCEEYIDTGGRLNSAVANVKSVREGESLARLQVLLDLAFVKGRLSFVGRENHDDVAPCSGIGDRNNFEAGLLCFINGFAACGQTDTHLYAGILEVKGVSVSL